MKKIVLLSGDDKALKDMNQWLTELTEGVAVETISDLRQFELHYLTKHREENAAEAEAKAVASTAPVDGSAAVDVEVLGANSIRHQVMHLYVADLQLLPDDPIPWIINARDQLIKCGYSDSANPAKVMLLGYEETGFDVDKFRHKFIDDLVLMPLDKSLFLQKAEIHLAEGDSVSASFLFKQKTDLMIEMGKDSWIESVSEYGFVIRNPAPLAKGVYARVHSRLFGTGLSTALVGRVYRVERHPVEVSMYLCYLSFHGITHEQLLNVRKFIKQDKANARRPSDREWPAVDLPAKTIAVIDMNTDSRELVKEALSGNFQNVAVYTFPSYSSFLKFCRRHARSSASTSDEAADSIATPNLSMTLAGLREISLLIDGATGDLISLEPVVKLDALFLGVKVADLQSNPAAWLSRFDDETRGEIEEFFAYLRSGQKSGHIQILGRVEGGGAVGLRLQGNVERRGEGDGVALTRLTLKEMTSDEWAQLNSDRGAGTKDSALNAIEGLYVDGSLLGHEPAKSIESLVSHLLRTGLIQSRESLAITVMGDERSSVSPAKFKLREVQDFLHKPLDRKLIVEKASIFLGGMILKRDNLDLTFHHAGVPGRITKEVLMEELSEFGLQIRHEAALKEHTFLRFFSSVFLDEAGHGLVGRCLYSTKDPETGLYHCFFAFFGVSDVQLKHIRNWIRGDYASRKEKSGG